MPNVFDKMTAFDSEYDDVVDWYLKNPETGIYSKLDIVSPNLDGSSQSRVFLSLKDLLTKADLSSADAAAVNAIYNLGVFINYAIQANAFGSLPKRPWRTQGYRAVKTASKTSALGIAETASALGTPVEPTYFEVAPSPKEIELVSSYTQRLAVLSRISDAVSVDQNRQVVERDFYRSLDADILGDVDTLPGNNFESLDRVTSAEAESGITAGDADIYGIDRTTETWADANLQQGAAGVDRDLTTDIIDDLYKGQAPYFMSYPDGKVYVTGFDTWKRWSALEATKQRLTLETVQMTVGDGIQTFPGERGGFKLAAYDGVPIVRDDLTTAVRSTLSRIYLFDFSEDRLGIAWGRPVEFLEKDDPFVVAHYIRGLWYGIGELYATHFKSQGKLTDIK